MNTPGDSVVSLMSRAENNVLIVAPFIRTPALSRLLESIPIGVSVSIITRWRAADLLAGASDLGILDLTESLSIPLLLRHDLHAKLFAADQQCLVGSANITDTALGWRTPANLELLVSVPRTNPHIVAFEQELFAGAVPATRELQSYLQDLVERLRKEPIFVVPEIADDENTPGLLNPEWVPRVMNPEELYYVYTNEDERVSRTALQVMRNELGQLGVAPGMTEPEFRAWVAATISQTPLVSGVIRHIDEEGSMTEPALERLLENIGVDLHDYSAREGIEVLQRWFTYFLPTQYQTAQDSIKLIRARDV